MSVGNNIRRFRKELGLTQEELGLKLGVQKAAVQKYEKGTVKIKADTLIKLAEIFETTPENILGWYMPENIKLAGGKEMVNIPVIGCVAAGISCFAEDNIIDYEPVLSDDINSSEQYVFLKITGDSMYPLFMENDLALIKVQDSIDSGAYGVVTIDNENGVIKRVVYGKTFIELQSINPMYPPRRFEGRDMLRIRVFGEVKEIKRKL